MQRYLLFVSLLVMTMLAREAGAQSTFIATDAVYVRAGQYVTMNFDTATAGNGLRVRIARAADNVRKSYIKFDFSTYSGPVGTATLNIWLDRALSTHYNALTNQYPDTALFYAVPNDNWNMHSITWNTAPDSGQHLFTNAFAHRSSAMPDTLYTWDVTPYIQAEYAGNKIASFLLVDSDTSHDTDLRLYSTTTPFFEPFLDISPTTGVDPSASQPFSFALMQNYPNPFNPTTVIRYAIPGNQHVRIDVHNVLGQLVSTLVDDQKSAGIHSVPFNAHNLGSGVYFYTITAGSYHATKRMLLVR
jgi:hypothetical protein